jgi:TAG lipase/steryl ester hydrolase/phospholipase A2/LPA acyltransferase
LAIWEKLSAIETNCTIEATLDACLARLTNKARERPLNGLSSRIPSWLSMNAIGQQAVASWGNPLEAGTSPGNRPWGSYPKGGSLMAGGVSWGHLPAVVQAQQVAAAAAAAAAAVRGSGSSGALNPGLSIGPGGCVAATCLEHQQRQGPLSFGSDPPMSPTGSCVSSGSNNSSNAASTSLEDGPATISEAMAAMANAANMGGLHRGYSYTAPALHHAHVQQHGNSPKHLQQQGGTMGTGQLPGGLSTAFGRHSSSAGGSAASVGAGSPVLLSAAGSLGSQGLSVPTTIHENLPDDKARRVASWGAGNDIADSVSEFPAAGNSVAAAAAAADAAAAAVAAAYHARRCIGSPKPGKGLLVRLFDSQGLLEEAANGLPTIPSSGSSGAMAASAAAAARGRAQTGDSRRSSLDSTEAHAPSEVLGELDCCDASVLTDIWSSLLPLATSALALQAASDGTQGLDFIAP